MRIYIEKGGMYEKMKKAVLTLCIVGIIFGCTSCNGAKQPETVVEETTQVQVPLTELYNAVKEAYGENYLPQMQYDAEIFENVFGIKEELYEEFIAEVPMMSGHVDTFVAIKAKEGKAEEVNQILETYQDNMLNNSFQYPMNLGKVEGARLYRNGDYVFYIILGGYPEDGSEVDAEMAKEQNQIAVDAIEAILGKADE